MKPAQRIECDARVHVFDFALELRSIDNCLNVYPAHVGLLPAGDLAMPIWRSGRRTRQNGSNAPGLHDRWNHFAGLRVLGTVAL
jgi:hypothetical protein